ncbi:hypothetical protein F5B21DRAFT_495332 [Xylaria acuta]|nr:hypothetical protein F5B21DRAFT_495332 [Xylaria acuta]
MSSSARARGVPGPGPSSFTQSTVGGAGTTRPTMKDKKEVIVIESDDEDVDDYGVDPCVESGASDVDGGDRSMVVAGRSQRIARASTNGLPTPHQHTYPAVSDHPFPETPTKKANGRAPGRIAALVRNTDTTLRRMPDTPSTLAPSGSLDGLHSSKKLDGRVPCRGGSPINDADKSSHRLPHTPSTSAPFSSPHGTQSLKPLSKGKLGGVVHGKADTNIGALRQKPNTTPNSVAVTNNKGVLPRSSSSALPPTFLPAVKPRVYSASRPSSKRNINIGSKKLEAFGFVSAASLLPATTNRNAATVPLVENRENSASAVTPTPILKSKPIRKLASKPIKQEEIQILGSSRESFPRATRNLTTAATSSPIYKFTPKPIKQEALEIQINAPQPLPRTPEKSIPTKRARTPSYSVGTYGDPYAIPSDSDSDSDNDNGKPHSCPPLKSFAKIADTHETASDVEAVLNQFPAWLDSPSPTELRSSYPGTSRPTISSLPGKRLWGDGVGNRGRVGRENRRVRFGEGDGFSTSPVPAKRTTALSQVTPPVKRNTSPIRGILSPSRITRTSSPTRRVTPVQRVNSLMRETPSAKRYTFPLHRLSPAQRTALLDKCGPSSPAERATPRVEITILDSDSESNGDSSKNEMVNSDGTSNPDRHHRGIPIRPRENILRVKEKREKKKKKKKRKREDAKEGKIASRHRNCDRDKWRRGERLKGR